MGVQRALRAQQGVVDWMLGASPHKGGGQGGGLAKGRVSSGGVARGASPTQLLPSLKGGKR